MLKIKITSFKKIKPIKATFNGWMDYKLSNIYRVIPDCDNLTLWVNGRNYGTFSAVTLINYLDYKWREAVCSTKEFKRGLKECIENGY